MAGAILQVKWIGPAVAQLVSTAARHAFHISDCQSDISLAAAVTELTSIAVHLQCGVSAVCLRCVCGVSAVCLQRQETNKYQQLNCYITSNSIKAGKTVLIKIEVIRSVE